nr:polysaccharide deacetylase family protein [Actinomycetota bacterium]
MTRLQALLERPLALLLLPLSLVPFLLVVPQMVESRELYDRRHKSGPLPAPRVALTPAQVERFQPVEPYERAVPVLAYHGIREERDGYSISRFGFAEQMAALDRMGFETISTEDFARFHAGEPVDLPERPILITFDDGRLDSYRGADAVLARHGFEATMFVITRHIERENPFYLTWRELHAMDDSGRWDIQPHAHAGHTKVAYDSVGTTAPFYAVRRYTRSKGVETFADYERRVSEDVFAVRDRMVEQGFEPHAFAVPYGNYGQRETNDPGIAPYMRSLLERQFGVFFVQHEQNDPEYAGLKGESERYEIHTDTTTDRLYMWLRDHSPGLIERRARERRRAAER